VPQRYPFERIRHFYIFTIDYKFYVIHGKIQACSVMSSRVKGTHVYQHSLYDSDWKRIELAECDGPDIECPVNYETIINFCKDTASQFPFVRIDFYEVGGKLYFGEYTFTPVTLRPSYNVFERFKDEWGNLMNLSVF